MKIVRCLTADNQVATGALQADGVIRVVTGSLATGYTLSEETVVAKQWLSPVDPCQIWCTGINYRKHAEEMGMALPERPLTFTKAINAVAGHDGMTAIPSHRCPSTKVDWECELAIVIGRAAKNVSREDALDYVFGYTCANDLSARDWQIDWGGGQWVRGKSFDGFCPLGPVIVTADELSDPHALRIQTRVNGVTMQDSNTEDFIFDVREIIEHLSADTTLLPGTVILTGTPAGVGVGRKPQVFLRAGDVVEVEIDHIGVLRTTMV